MTSPDSPRVPVTPTGPTVVVVEDEPDIREVLVQHLNREGYRVEASGRGDDGLRRIRDLVPDLVLLDLMLPGLSGIEICREMKLDRRTRSIPIIMVTAKTDETDIVLGLGMGADDYVPKPFRPRELVARVRAVLRRSGRRPVENLGQRLVRGAFVLDPRRHEVRAGGRTVDLTATEFRILQQLALEPGRVFSRDELIEAVLGDDATVTRRSVDVHIRGIRRKLDDDRHLVETVRGSGYRFADLESEG